MNGVKNIIFDLGGVLINLDFAKSTNSFRDLGFPHFENMFSQFKADQLFEKLEKGLISTDEFYTIMVKIGKEGITADQVKTAWNSMLLDFRSESLAFLKELRKSYNLFLLSNTNSIHFDAFNNILREQTGLSSLDDLFTKSYYSHLVGLRKPDKTIFDFVLADAGLHSTETLFIDDTKDNINAAEKIGFKTRHLLPGEKIETISLI